jgi:hypothetical protein
MIKMKQWKTYKKMHKEMRKKGIEGTGEKMDGVCFKFRVNSGMGVICN